MLLLGAVMGPTVGLCCQVKLWVNGGSMLLLGEVMGQFAKHLVYKPLLSG